MSGLTEKERYDKAHVGGKSDPETQLLMDGGQVLAKYKIEIHFGPGRTTRADYNALVTIWESGKHFHGGGDDLAYWCLDCRAINDMGIDAVWKFFRDVRRRHKVGDGGKVGCGGVITSDHLVKGAANCPHCHMMVKADYLTGHLGFHGSTGELATFIEGLFNDVGRNADVYAKFHRTDIRYITMVEKKGAAEAHRLKGMHIYPLGRLITDTVNGASVQGRLLAFFNS